jgi:hypothetical protein
MNHHPDVLIVGGLVKPTKLEAIRLALPGVDVEWIPTRDSDPGASAFAYAIRRPETRLVVVLYGLIRHQHAHDLTRLARQQDKRFLRHYRSPNPSLIKLALVGQRRAAR